MKLSLFLIVILFYSFANCQRTTTIVYDAHGNIISGSFIKTVPPHPVVLKDSISNYTYALDSTHIYITAYDSVGKMIWKTDPYIDNHIEEYRTSRPIVVNIVFGQGYNADSKKKEKDIWIEYNNTQFGYLNLMTGKYRPEGQD